MVVKLHDQHLGLAAGKWEWVSSRLTCHAKVLSFISRCLALAENHIPGSVPRGLAGLRGVAQECPRWHHKTQGRKNVCMGDVTTLDVRTITQLVLNVIVWVYV